LSSGAPDVRLVPSRLIGRAYRRALALNGGDLLAYGDPEGHPALRSALASMLADRRGLAVAAGDVVVTRGSSDGAQPRGSRTTPPRRCRRSRTLRSALRAIYVTPHHQYPTTVTLKAGRRLALLALARARRIAIIENEYDHEFHYDGHPVLPLASADQTGVVVYIGTLSKILAPGVRIG
jgi:GntR family transcriptional regulator/MocR family aminotransferase